MADVADARRRHPDVDLSGYAAARGLDVLGSRNAAGFFAALPLDEQLQFNVLRGTLPGGEQGILFHHVLPVPVSVDGSGEGLIGCVYRPPGGRLRMRDLLGGLIPFADLVVDVVADIRRPAEVADPLASCVGVPSTVAAVLVPEVALETFTMDTRDRSLSQTAREALRHLKSRPYAKVEVKYGTLVVRVNGYLRDEAELDGLAQVTCALARELRAAGELVAGPRPFDRRLPPPDEHLSAPWGEPLDAYASQHGLAPEDPAAYHRAFPALAVPGRAFAVLRGELAAGVTGRVAWHTEKSIATNNDGRNAVLLPAPPGAEPTPRAGIRLAGEPLNYWIGDGILAVWELRSKELRGDLGDMDALIRCALALRTR